jgi:hypothetical protein
MLRRFGSVIIAVILVGAVTTACIVRSRPAHRTVYVQDEGKHKKHQKVKKPEKHKKHHD